MISFNASRLFFWGKLYASEGLAYQLRYQKDWAQKIIGVGC